MRMVYKGWGIWIELEYRLGQLWLSGPYRKVDMVAFKLLAFFPLALLAFEVSACLVCSLALLVSSWD